MSQKQIIKKIYKAFYLSQRPNKAVDDPSHCLSCEETQEAHSNLPNIRDVTVDDFRLCNMSIECLNENAFKYYMPKLLEMALTKEKISSGIFYGETIISFLVSQLIPNKYGDRFKYYLKNEIDIIIEVLELLHQEHVKENYEYWDFDRECIVHCDEDKEIVEACEQALLFWNKKLKS